MHSGWSGPLERVAAVSLWVGGASQGHSELVIALTHFLVRIYTPPDVTYWGHVTRSLQVKMEEMENF